MPLRLSTWSHHTSPWLWFPLFACSCYPYGPVRTQPSRTDRKYSPSRGWRCLAPCTIPLLANTQTRSSKNRVTCTLKFTLHRPRKSTLLADFLHFLEGMAQAEHMPLKGRCACLPLRLSTWSHHTSLWLWFPLFAWSCYPYGPVRAQTLGLHISESIKAWLLSGAPRIYDRRDLELPGNRQIALPSILLRYFSIWSPPSRQVGQGTWCCRHGVPWNEALQASLGSPSTLRPF